MTQPLLDSDTHRPFPATGDAATGAALSKPAPFTDGVDLTAADGAAVVPRRRLLIKCTVAGNVTMTLASGYALVIPVAVGLTSMDVAITELKATGTTATATYAYLS